MRVFLLGLVSAALAGCTASLAEGTYVRLHNATPDRLEAVRVTFADPTPVDYGALVPGQVSDYRPARGAYRYAKIEARVNGEPFTLQPIDFVGETPLGPGRYTYRLVPWPGQRGFTIAEAHFDREAPLRR